MLQITDSQRVWQQERRERLARMTMRPAEIVEPVAVAPVAVPDFGPDPCAIDVTCWPPFPDRVQYVPKKVRIKQIQLRVCEHFEIGMIDLLSRRRTAAVVMPRHIAMYLSKTLTGNSYPEIGRRFGGLDHTSALHAVRRITRLVTEDQKLEATVSKIREAIQ